MPATSYPFIDIAVHERVRVHFARGEAAVLFSPDMRQVLWSNGEGAALFSGGSIYDFLEAGPPAGDVAFRQMAAAARALAQPGDRRGFTMRVGAGFRRVTVQASVELILLKDSERAVLFTAPRAGASLSNARAAERMIAGLEDPDTHMAVLDGDGGVLAASAGFTALGMTADTRRLLVRAAARDAGWLIKRPVPTGKGHLPAAIGRISDDPPLSLLLAVETILGHLDAMPDFDGPAQPQRPVETTNVEAAPSHAATAPLVAAANTAEQAVEADDGAGAATDPQHGRNSETDDLVQEPLQSTLDTSSRAEALDAPKASAGPDMPVDDVLLEGSSETAENQASVPDAPAEGEARASETSDPAGLLNRSADETPDLDAPGDEQAVLPARETAEDDQQSESMQNADAAALIDLAADAPARPPQDELSVDPMPTSSDDRSSSEDEPRLPTTLAEALMAYESQRAEEVEDRDGPSDAQGENAVVHQDSVAKDDGAQAETALAQDDPAGPISEVVEPAASEVLTGEMDDRSPTAASGGFRFDPALRTVRFVWKIDADGRFTEISEEFAQAVGPKAADVLGLLFVDLAALLDLDPQETIASLLARHDTWSGKTIYWPVESHRLRAPVDLAALPTYSRERAFDGFRGFGIVRLADAIEDTSGIGPMIGALDGTLASLTEAKTQTLAQDAADAETIDEVDGLDWLDVTEDAAPAPLSNTDGEANSGTSDREDFPASDDEAEADAEDLLVFRTDDQAIAFEDEAPVAGHADSADAAQGSVQNGDEADLDQDDGHANPADRPHGDTVHSALPETDEKAGEPAGAEPRADLGDERTAAQDDQPAADETDDPFRGERPALRIVTPAPPEDDRVVHLQDHRRAVDGLSRSEQAAFREIARQLGEAFGAPQADLAEEPGAQMTPQTQNEQAGPTQATTAHFGPTAGEGPVLTAEIVDPQTVAILIHNGEDLLHANPALLMLTGYGSLAELIGEGGLEALFVGEDDGLDDVPAGAVMMIRNDGRLVPVSARLQSVRWEDRGTVLMLALSALDSDPPKGNGQTSLHAVSQSQPAPVLKPASADDAAQSTPSSMDETPAHADSDAEISRLRIEVDELSAILETATDGVVVLGPEGEIRSLNRSANALFNYDDEDIRGKPFAMLFAHESQKSVIDYLAGLAGHGVASVLNDGREVIGREASGGFIPLFMTMGRLSFSKGYCAVIRDITQWKRTEDELRNAKRAAETANAHKSEFLARVSHEIRTPLNAIIGFSDMMASEHFGPIGNPRYVEYAGDIGRSGRYVLDIVNDLLDISKIEAGEMELDFAAVLLNEAVAEAVALVQPQANAQRVIIRTSLSSAVPGVVADQRSIKQIVLNILSNAIRFTPAGGQIVVSSSYEQNGTVTLRIRDTGVGMTRGELEQAMKPFRQVTTGTRARGDGTGLGLPLTKAMVEANRANFAISSAPNEGTLVEIAFPPQRVLAE
ncbi:ATP-binding protein [Xaviernesmea oryzae]|uniref:ATP-binding protein n=1 Tax=Xaviernesmea oryzae TaxID=464029 RepID=UPI0008B43D60|nr:ATP-binding protein [Xaviernesmea oryzae]SEL81822.1 PAS domain S-box-containing protein [Xaviernesmea oryzae]